MRAMLLVLVAVCTLGCAVAMTPRLCWTCQGTKGSSTCGDPFLTNVTTLGVVLQPCHANQHVCYKLHNPDKSIDRGCTDKSCPDPRHAAEGDSWIKLNFCHTCEEDKCNTAPARSSPPGALLLGAAATLLVAAALGAATE